MIQAVAILLAFQLAGEVTARGLGLTLPGPVLGMSGLLIAFMLVPSLHARVAPTGRGLLSHLSLLFVPAGVGIVGHLSRFGGDGVGVIVAILVSTALAIGVGGAVFVGVAKLTGSRE